MNNEGKRARATMTAVCTNAKAEKKKQGLLGLDRESIQT